MKAMGCVLVLLMASSCSNPILDSELKRAVLAKENIDQPEERRSKIIPWVECNWPDARLVHGDPESPTVLNHVVEGLREWERVTNTAIITTLPGKTWLYDKLQSEVPEMHIIPGIKTMDLFSNSFDRLEGWHAVREQVQLMSQATNQTMFALEHEWALERYVRGEQSIDFLKLKAGLRLLPEDIEYIWHPSVYWFIAGEAGYDRLVDLCRVVEATVPAVRWVDQRYCASDAVVNTQYERARRMLVSLASKPTIPILYFLGDEGEHVWWQDQQAGAALSQVHDSWGDGSQVIIYPGLTRWGDAAQVFGGECGKCTAAKMVNQLIGPSLCPMPIPTEAECDLNYDNCVDLHDVAIMQLMWEP